MHFKRRIVCFRMPGHFLSTIRCVITPPLSSTCSVCLETPPTFPSLIYQSEEDKPMNEGARRAQGGGGWGFTEVAFGGTSSLTGAVLFLKTRTGRPPCREQQAFCPRHWGTTVSLIHKRIKTYLAWFLPYITLMSTELMCQRAHWQIGSWGMSR